MELITSKNNSKIKYAGKLVSDSSFRKKEKLFTVEGLRICTDAVDSGIKITDTFFVRESYEKHQADFEKVFEKSEKVYEVSTEILSKISDTGTPQGIFCICEFGKNIFDYKSIKTNGRYIALENIQDPSNLGAVSRTAEALGIDGAIICGCCDIYNPKVLRGSMGSLFRLPIFRTDSMEKFLNFSKGAGLKSFTTTTDKNAKKINEINFSDGIVCVIGNEGNGVTEKTASLCDEKITIPMQGRAQSLNASMAACITMWEMLR